MIIKGEFRTEKKCPKCGVVKTRDQYTIRKSGRVGHLASYCKTCNVDSFLNRKQRDATIYRRVEWKSKLKKYYGISPEDYFRMLEAQGGCCAICKSKSPKARKYRKAEDVVFCVDHCHTTGRVRGLLCTACNRAVGLISDSPENAIRMAEYLKQQQENEGELPWRTLRPYALHSK